MTSSQKSVPPHHATPSSSGVHQGLPFQDIIAKLDAYWRSHGCLTWLPYSEKVGAGTFNTATVLRVLGPEPWNVAYVEPSFRPDDGRYAENPNRVQMHHQYQVILQPAPRDPPGLYLGSLKALGINLADHDVRFVEDNWESPAIAAWGLGWEVWLDGMEITQFTYFQQSGGITLELPAVEITYGLERLASYLQSVPSIWDVTWDNQQLYADLLKSQEIEYCVYDFEVADIERLKSMAEIYKLEAVHALDRGLVLPAYDYVVRLSHTFNLLDSRGAVGLAERVKFFAEMRTIARRVADGFLANREKAGFPLRRHLPPAIHRAVPTPRIEAQGSAQDFVLEIGTEELATGAIAPLSEALQSKLTELFAEVRLTHGEIKILSTPRRLVALVANLEPRQADRTINVRGPRQDACLKNPKALEGFCRKNGIALDAVTYVTDQGTSYASATVHEVGRSAETILAERLPALIGSLKSESTMRWLCEPLDGADAQFSFNRPIRWIVALFGDQLVPFRVAGIVSGAISYGGRWDESPEIRIPRASAFRTALEESGIILDPQLRRAEILSQVQACAAARGGVARVDDRLLDEVMDLVERPAAVVGEFSPDFLKLPAIVLVGVMAKHMRCFPLYATTGELLPCFVAVRNGRPERIDQVRDGFARVITARFSDAKFFIERDNERSLEDLRERTRSLTFLTQAGSMFDKSERLQKLTAALIAGPMPMSVDTTHLDRAARFAKADLGSQMVTEMSSLQGEMGALYAASRGENAAVATALRELYMPRATADQLPQSPVGKVLAIADRLDTIAALFSAGIEPRGSADPYGLRRDGLALVTLLLGTGISIDLRAAFDLALSYLPKMKESAPQAKILDFVGKRLEVALRDAGHRYDVVRAVLGRLGHNPVEARQTVIALETWLAEPGAADTITAYLRAVRILKHATEKGVHIASAVAEKLLSDPAERDLAKALAGLNFTGMTPFVARLSAITELRSTIQEFFEKTLVMAEDETLRANRLALANRVASILSESADLSELAES